MQWAIVKEKVTPKHLCSCGNEKFALLSNKNIDRKGKIYKYLSLFKLIIVY